MLNFQHTVTERFMRYVQIDTQSDPSSPTCPSTMKQKDLGRLLVKELLEMGIQDAELDIHGYVYASIPANTDKKVPVICFCSHMDTSPDCSGTHVKPQIHRNYKGKDIVLPGDTTQIIRVSEHPELLNQLGNDIITADGTTLLGADNKSGISAIMDTAQYLMAHQEVKHGKIRILFTPDEEIGRGVDKVDMQKLGADIGYTIDGETLGHIEDETFSADMATIHIYGFSTHPGFAKGKMQSALKIASELVSSLPKDRISPETTEGKEGFVHLIHMNGSIEKVTLQFIIRSFSRQGLVELERELSELAAFIVGKYSKARYELQVSEQYRNMKEILESHPSVVEYAVEAISRAGLHPHLSSIRGGTDGSRLSFMGLPCPNIFAGEHAFHSRQEWVSVQDMEKAAEVMVHLAMIWTEKA
ncbi:MAG TPA: peptidase T [Bacteroidia bacterium]|jgi:tripeptide aminopeptidase|nr:peptidase T [Bacteroidia bacterium]